MSRSNGMRWSNPEDELLVTCVRAEFGQAERARVVDICREYEIQWERVFATARLHSIAPLVYRNLGRIDPAELGIQNGALARFRHRFGENLVAKLDGSRNPHTTPTEAAIPAMSRIPLNVSLAEKSATATVNPNRLMATSCEMKKVLEMASPTRLGRSIEINLLPILTQIFEGLLHNQSLALQLLFVG